MVHNGKSGRDKRAERELEDIFALARQEKHSLPADLMQRIMRDAAEAQPRQVAAVRETHGYVGLFSRLKAAIGGWPALAAMASAAVAGIWFGVYPPSISSGDVPVLTSETDLYLMELFADLVLSPEDI